jgi:uncharacterized protein YciI
MRIHAAALLVSAILGACVNAAPPAQPPPPEVIDYVFVFLRAALNTPHQDDAEGEKIQAAHMANIKRLYDEGHLVAAGPFLDGTALRGVLVLKTASRAEAQQWLDSDPAVKAGRLIGDLHPFAAPAGTFRKPSDAKVDMETYAMVVLTDRFRRDRAPMESEAAYLDRLRASGKLALAALFSNGELGGVLVLTVPLDEAQKIAFGNPLVVRGYMTAEVHPWISQRGVLVR